MRFGYFKHWHQPEFPCQEFMREEGYDIKQIDYSKPNYLENFDVAIVEQNGFNDYIENDEEYIAGWVARGGILLFMHQDYQRWAPYFLPNDVGYTQLIHRHIPTIGDATKYGQEPYYIYMMPWIEKEGKGLFNVPEKITPDEMIDWRVCSNTFRIIRQYKETPAEMLRTAAQSCYLANDKWDILGSYMDPGVRDGALILRAKHGKGMFFLNQLLFPEKRPAEGDRCLAFWKKYLKNLQAYFERFKNGEPEPVIEEPKELPIKKNYKLNIHMHSLDWYGCDSAPGTINAMMRYLGFDICGLAVKDVGPYAGKLDPAKYSDDKVLFLDGQEYHPFNWQTCTDDIGHNNYHMLPIGIDPDAYTPEFTRSLYGDEEVDAYLKKAIDYVHEKHGAICATHPVKVDYWTKYNYDAVDEEPLIPMAGTTIEKFWLEGGRIAIMNSVDLFGFRRILDNPAVNFVYLQGEKPCRDSVVKAIRSHHTIAAAWFNEADVTLNGKLPGTVVSKSELENATVSISAEIAEGTITEVRVYADAEVIFKANPGTKTVNLEVPLKGVKADKFIRVEAEGEEKHRVMVSTPFFVE
ncbi:MAG: hypothetical protein IJW05_07935 [Lentisphaeria bacterium]|nr:hypothetical protein [Lentisphaeria bacterium]